MARIIVCLVLLLGAWSDASIIVERVIPVTDVFDQLLQEGLDKYFDILDPLRLDGIQLNSSRLFPLYKIKLHDVEVDGLADMSRVGEVRLLKSRHTKTLQVQLEAPRVFYAAKSQIILPGKTLKRALFGHAASVKAYLEVRYDTVTGEVSLQTFRIAELTNLHLRYEGSPIVIEQIENMLLSIVARYFSGAIRFTIAKTFTHRLSHIFSSSPVFKEIMQLV